MIIVIFAEFKGRGIRNKGENKRIDMKAGEFVKQCKTRTDFTPERRIDARAGWQPGGRPPHSWTIKWYSERPASVTGLYTASGIFHASGMTQDENIYRPYTCPSKQSCLKLICGTSLALRLDVGGNVVIFLNYVFLLLSFIPFFLPHSFLNRSSSVQDLITKVPAFKYCILLSWKSCKMSRNPPLFVAIERSSAHYLV